MNEPTSEMDNELGTANTQPSSNQRMWINSVLSRNSTVRPRFKNRRRNETRPAHPLFARDRLRPKDRMMDGGARKPPRELRWWETKGVAAGDPAESGRLGPSASPPPRRRKERRSEPKRDADLSESGSLAMRRAHQAGPDQAAGREPTEWRSACPQCLPHAEAAVLKHRGQRRRVLWPHESGVSNQCRRARGTHHWRAEESRARTRQPS